MNEYLDENKKKRNKLAFTLIELLAVIVILAVILIIAVPKIMETIKNARVGSMESSVKLVAKSIEEKYEASLANGEEGTLQSTGSCMNIGNLDTDEYEACIYTIDDNGKVSVTLKGKETGKFADLICIDSTKTNAECTTSQSYIVSFDANGGTMEDVTKELAYNQTYGEMPTPTRKIYRFDGWYTEETGGVKVENTTLMLNTSNQTLYAHWTYLGKTITLDDEIYQGYEYDDGIYIYRYMQEYSINLTTYACEWTDISIEGWGVKLKDTSITEINVDPLSVINNKPIVSTSAMYIIAKKLTNIKLDNFDTSNVINMSGMFGACTSLKELDLSNFDTSNVTNMSIMFATFSSSMSLEKIIGLENFDTSKVTNMYGMFYECVKLKTINVSSFDTSNVTDMQFMFGSYNNYMELESIIGLENFDTSNVTNMGNMFQFCDNLKSLDLSNFDTSNVTNMSRMLFACTSLKTLDLSNFDTSNVTDMSAMFYKTNSLTSILARTEEDKAKFDASSYKPSTAIVTVKTA